MSNFQISESSSHRFLLESKYVFLKLDCIPGDEYWRSILKSYPLDKNIFTGSGTKTIILKQDKSAFMYTTYCNILTIYPTTRSINLRDIGAIVRHAVNNLRLLPVSREVINMIGFKIFIYSSVERVDMFTRSKSSTNRTVLGAVIKSSNEFSRTITFNEQMNMIVSKPVIESKSHEEITFGGLELPPVVGLELQSEELPPVGGLELPSEDRSTTDSK